MDFGDGTMPKDREEKWDGGEKWVAGRNKRDGSRARARDAAPRDSTNIVLLATHAPQRLTYCMHQAAVRAILSLSDKYTE